MSAGAGAARAGPAGGAERGGPGRPSQAPPRRGGRAQPGRGRAGGARCRPLSLCLGMSDSGGGGGGGPGGEEGGMEVSGSAVQNVADVSVLQKHLRKLVPLLLEDGGEAPAALEAALEEKGAVEHMRKFLSDPQVHTVLVERSTLKGEAGAEPPRWQNGRWRPQPPPCRGWEGRASAAAPLRLSAAPAGERRAGHCGIAVGLGRPRHSLGGGRVPLAARPGPASPAAFVPRSGAEADARRGRGLAVGADLGVPWLRPVLLGKAPKVLRQAAVAPLLRHPGCSGSDLLGEAESRSEAEQKRRIKWGKKYPQPESTCKKRRLLGSSRS